MAAFRPAMSFMADAGSARGLLVICEVSDAFAAARPAIHARR
jgi:hypothetical protein